MNRVLGAAACTIGVALDLPARLGSTHVRIRDYRPRATRCGSVVHAYSFTRIQETGTVGGRNRTRIQKLPAVFADQGS